LDEKSAAMAALNEVHAEMTAQLQAAGMPEDLSPGDFIRGLGDDQLSRQHADFLDAAGACEEANLRNARLIRHSQHLNSNLLDEKSAAMAALNEVHAEMTAQLQAAGMPEDLSPGDFIRGLGDDQLSRQHADFLDAAGACEEANLRNARLIRHSQHINSNLLDLLRNQGETSLNVYDRLGNANRARPGRPLSRA